MTIIELSGGLKIEWLRAYPSGQVHAVHEDVPGVLERSLCGRMAEWTPFFPPGAKRCRACQHMVIEGLEG